LEDEDMAGTESYVPWMAPKVVVGGWWWLLAGGYWCCFPGNDMITSHSKINDVSVPPRLRSITRAIHWRRKRWGRDLLLWCLSKQDGESMAR